MTHPFFLLFAEIAIAFAETLNLCFVGNGHAALIYAKYSVADITPPCGATAGHVSAAASSGGATAPPTNEDKGASSGCTSAAAGAASADGPATDASADGGIKDGTGAGPCSEAADGTATTSFVL